MADHLFEGGPGDLAPVTLRPRPSAEPDPWPAPLPDPVDERPIMVDAAATCVVKLQWWEAEQLCARWGITGPELAEVIVRRESR